MDQARLPIEDDKGYLVRIRFQEFLQTYGSENSQLMKEANEELTQQMILENYMLQIEYMIHWNKSTVFVNFEHLMKADAELAEAVEFDFYRFEPYLRHAIYNIVVVDNKNYVYDVDKGPREFFVAFYNMPTVEKIRTVRTSKIGRLVSISGTVTRTSEVRPELYYGCFICRNCGTTIPSVEQQFQYTEPIVCKNPQCSDGAKDFQLITDKSLFIDWQRLRIQENADEIPAGSMPRSLEVICRNEIVEVAKAGDKIVLTGTVIVLPDTSGVGRAGETAVSSKKSSGNEVDGVQGLKKLGVKEMAYKLSFIASSIQITDRRSGKANNHHVIPFFNESVNQTDYNPASNSAFDNSEEIPNFTQQDLKMIENMFHLPNLYSAMAESICPAVFGHLEVKRGILLMLLGGVHKKTLEGISLRGDINVCIVGDPSCAKSQFLKYVHGFLPRTIYTSGKSSSAAGLTASVVRDAETGEFCVEAGALMLADNGICCIDEFDKMDAADQVAIHEAMEQQTISITKAGIQATLNARTSILAAANPVFGRYDKTKTLKANIAISAAIMSRFDLFFIILDECDKTSDEKIARHIVSIHKADGINRANTEVKFSREQLQKYITFARTINPEFNERSRKTLVECYRLLRQNDMLGKNKTAYRITVRQLESLIRLSEALARLHLNQIVEEAYVKEAFRLLQKSIIFVESESIQLDEEEEDGGMNGMEEDGIDHHVNMEEVMNDEIERHLQTDPKSFSELMSNVNVVDADRNKTPVPSTTEQQHSEAAAGVEDPSKAKDKEKEKDKKGNKQKTQISAKEYEEITDLLKYHLKHLEDEDPDNFHGCSWKDLTTWYLTEHCKDILNDESAIEGKKKVVNQIIRRLIKHEGSIVVLQSHQEEDVEKIPNEEKILKLHPSVQI